MVDRDSKNLIQLNQIQQQVMDLVVDGRDISEIAKTVGMSEFTVSIIINSAVRALSSKTLAHAAVLHRDQTTKSDTVLNRLPAESPLLVVSGPKSKHLRGLLWE